jgi:uncharacterized cupin superfamily protein
MIKRVNNNRSTASFAAATRALRIAGQMSLQALADRANVSKSMISKVERGDTQPSLDVAVRLAEALGSTVSEMLRRDEYARVIKLEHRNQAVVKDPKANWERRQLSPAFSGSTIEVLHAKVGAGVEMGSFPPHKKGTEEYIVILKGKLEVTIGGAKYSLEEGDSLFFEANRGHALRNPSARIAEYLVVIKH